MNGKGLEHIEEEKDLGVLIDERLNFHRQAAVAVKKASRVLGLIKRTFSRLDKTTLPLLYTSIVRSHLEYGNVIWVPFSKGDIIAVEKIQRRATEMIPEIAHLSYEKRLEELKLPSLLHRRRRGDMIQISPYVNLLTSKRGGGFPGQPIPLSAPNLEVISAPIFIRNSNF